MAKLRQVVKEVCSPFETEWQYFMEKPEGRVHAFRRRVVDRCIKLDVRVNGKPVTVVQVDNEILKFTTQLNEKAISKGESLGREGLTSSTPISLDDPKTKLVVSKDWGEEAPPLVKEGAQALCNVPHSVDEHMWTVTEEYIETLSMNDAERCLPSRVRDEQDRRGFNVFHIYGNSVESVGRLHPKSKGEDFPYNKIMRACVKHMNKKLTPLGKKVLQAHLADQGLLFDSVRKKALSNPLEFVKDLVAKGNKPGEALLKYRDIYSYHLAESTRGYTPFGIWKDISGSGFSIQMLLLRIVSEVLKRIATNYKCFMPVHQSFVNAMTELSWANGKYQELANANKEGLTRIAKKTVMVKMYTAAVKGVFHALTEQHVSDDPSKFNASNVNPILQEYYLKGKSPEEAYVTMVEISKALSSLFAAKFYHSLTFQRYWTKEWESVLPKGDKKGEYFEGYWLDYPGGGKVLIPYLSENKDIKVQRESRWVGGSSSACVNKPTFNEGSSPLVTGVCRAYDSAMLYKGVVLSEGKVLASMHDAIEVHPNDEPTVQRNTVIGINEIFSVDLMNTGKEQVILPLDVKPFRT